MMFRMTKPYGTVGLATAAISAVDLALWDARGKALDKPVYELLGDRRKSGYCATLRQRRRLVSEPGFTAFKLACLMGLPMA